MHGVVREKHLGLLVFHTGVDDDIVTLLPVNRSSDPVLVASLESIKNTDDLVEVASCHSRICKDETDGLLGIDDEYASDL